jgi:hypothetical protein
VNDIDLLLALSDVINMAFEWDLLRSSLFLARNVTF